MFSIIKCNIILPIFQIQFLKNPNLVIDIFNLQMGSMELKMRNISQIKMKNISGFHLVIQVLGESGLGKSTFINSLFLTQVYNSGSLANNDKIEKTTEIREHQVSFITIKNT